MYVRCALFTNVFDYTSHSIQGLWRTSFFSFSFSFDFSLSLYLNHFLSIFSFCYSEYSRIFSFSFGCHMNKVNEIIEFHFEMFIILDKASAAHNKMTACKCKMNMMFSLEFINVERQREIKLTSCQSKLSCGWQLTKNQSQTKAQ